MVRLDVADLRSDNLDHVLDGIRDADEISIRIGSSEGELLSTAIFAAAVSQQVRRVETQVSASAPLYTPLITTAAIFPTQGLNVGFVPDLFVANDGFLCVPTPVLNSSDPRRFTQQLARLMTDAGIRVPADVLATLASVGFEANSNAEEHGSVPASGENRAVYRFFAIKQHSADFTPSGRLGEYVRAYADTFGLPKLGWVEMVVTDAGTGAAYPGYYLDSLSRRWESTDLYATPFQVEALRFQMLLNQDYTTKGDWGRVLNTFTKPGTGTKQIKIRLAYSRGFASVRAGRATASWVHLPEQLTPAELASVPMYEVDSTPRVLLRGTVWQVLLPLTTAPTQGGSL